MTDGLPMPRRLIAVIAISFGNALVMIDGAIANVALPSIARDLGVDSSSVVSIVSVYQLTLVMCLLPLSSLGDQIGHRRMYISGQIVFTVASALCLFVGSLPFLLVLRVAQAAGAAAALSVTSAMLRDIYPKAILGRGLGINSVVIASSSALAPTLGGAVLAIAPWPWVFACAAPFAFGSLLFSKALPEPRPRDEPFDLVSALLCAVTFGLIVGGMESAVHGDSPVVSAAIVLLGLYIGRLFVARELRQPRPILPLDLLSIRIVALSIFASVCIFIASMSLMLSLPFRLQHVYGFSPAAVGAVLAPWPLTMMVISPLSGWLSDRIPAGIMGGIGMTIAATALVLLAFLPDNPTHWDIAWRMVMCGGGFGMFMSPNARLIISRTPRERAAATGGMLQTTRLLGQTVGATLVAALLALGFGNGPVPALIAASLAATAALCSIVRLSPRLSSH